MNPRSISSLAKAAVLCTLIGGFFATLNGCDRRYHETKQACIKAGGTWSDKRDFGGDCIWGRGNAP